MSRDRVLVIGAGFLGCAIARGLNSERFPVTLLSPNVVPPAQGGEPILVRGRQEDEGLLAELLPEHSIVVHAAWGTTPSSSADRPMLEAATGVAPYLAFLETLKRFPSVRLLFLSSGGTVYGNPARLPVNEDFPLQPLSCHGSGKAAAELFLPACRRRTQARDVVLRPSNIFGPGQALRPGFGVLRHLLQCALEDTPFTLLGDGSQVRDYLYIDDFVDAVVRLTKRPDLSGAFNIGSGCGTGLLQLISAVERTTGRQIRINAQPGHEGEVAAILLDTARIQRAVGWQPTISLPEGISRTFQWLRDGT